MPEFDRQSDRANRFAPIAVLPGWFSATLVGIVTGLLTLLAFKFTSNQRAIKQVRSDIKANLLALALFKDSVPVSLKSQGRIVVAAARLLAYSIVPIAVMLIPMALLLGQLSLWYQARPLRVGENAVVTMNLNGPDSAEWPTVQLDASAAFRPTLGPVKISDERAMCWNVEANQAGYHRLALDVDGMKIDKELAIGDGPMRVSLSPGLELVRGAVEPGGNALGRQFASALDRNPISQAFSIRQRHQHG